MTFPVSTESPAAELVDVYKYFPARRRAKSSYALRAVDGISLSVKKGRTLGLVGESGSGKSTVARLLLRFVAPTAGQVMLSGVDITTIKSAELRGLRRQMQMVFQDPYSSFDPLASIGDSLGEALRSDESNRNERGERATALVEQVGLRPDVMRRRPSQLSGGQLQRAAIARALAVGPSIIALDEPVSSLDVSTQAQIVNLLRRLQAQTGVAYLFISHDLSIVRHLSHDVAVMYLGRVMEYGPAAAVYNTPRHPYTEALLAAVPVADPVRQRARPRVVLEGDVPSPARPPSGCRFRTRCPWVMPICAEAEPPPTTTDDGTVVYCHLHTEGPQLRGSSVRTLLPAPSTSPSQSIKSPDRSQP